VVTPRITRKMLESDAWRQTQNLTQSVDTLETLTPREREVAHAISEGLTNRELAERFQLSEATIKTYVSRILSKLQARDRVEIVLRVQRASRWR
jgi:RNA polymerase sigma factor (sigma-70 family)